MTKGELKVCYFCKHFSISFEDDYSDLTPGEGFEMKCFEDIWRFDPKYEGEAKFAECLNTAADCPEYEKVR